MIKYPWASSATASGEVVLTIPIEPGKIIADRYLQVTLDDERAIDRLIYELMKVKLEAFRSFPKPPHQEPPIE